MIHFPATPINDQSIAVFYVENRHIDKNHFKHPVPRIGNGKSIKALHEPSIVLITIPMKCARQNSHE